MPAAKSTTWPAKVFATVTVIGAGGNIGSQLIPQLARIPELKKAILVDGDVYVEENLRSQSIYPHEVGRPKALVQQRHLQRLAPRLVVEAVARSVQDVPLCLLAADVIVACVDSRRARLYVNEVAWRLGTSWIDTAIDGFGLLARCNVYVPAPDQPCLECGWSDQDYSAVEQVFACQAGTVATPPTNAPASLGGIAAAYAASECAKILRHDLEHVARGQQILFDLRHHRQLATRLPRNPRCRFDHQTWRIDHLVGASSQMSLEKFWNLVERATGGEVSAVCVPGQSFAGRLFCPNCGPDVRQRLVLVRRMTRRQTLCAVCGAARTPAGFDMFDSLAFDRIEKDQWRRSLGSLGFRAGDVVSVVGASGDSYLFHLGAAATDRAVDQPPSKTTACM